MSLVADDLLTDTFYDCLSVSWEIKIKRFGDFSNVLHKHRIKFKTSFFFELISDSLLEETLLN